MSPPWAFSLISGNHPLLCRKYSCSIAQGILGSIEIARYEQGRPLSEPRHPDLESGRPWPLMRRASSRQSDITVCRLSRDLIKDQTEEPDRATCGMSASSRSVSETLSGCKTRSAVSIPTSSVMERRNFTREFKLEAVRLVGSQIFRMTAVGEILPYAPALEAAAR